MISIQKRGKVYQYRFEVARVNGKRKYLSKSGFKTKSQAFAADKRHMMNIKMEVVKLRLICLMVII